MHRDVQFFYPIVDYYHNESVVSGSEQFDYSIISSCRRIHILQIYPVVKQSLGV